MMSKDELDPRNLMVSPEMKDLIAKLRGREDFASVRGTCLKTVSDLLTDTREKAATISEFDRLLEKTCTDLTHMASKWAAQSYAGNEEAAVDLLEVLEQSGSLLPGETFINADLDSYALMIFEPEKTFLLMEAITWIGRGAAVCYLERESPDFLTRWFSTGRSKLEYFAKLGERLLVAFPSLDNLMFQETRRSSSPAQRACLYDVLLAAYARDVILKCPVFSPEVRGLSMIYDDVLFMNRIQVETVLLRHYPHGSSLKSHWPSLNCSLAFLAPGDVAYYQPFRKYNIGIWEFRLPKVVGRDFGGVGLYPAEDHEAWVNVRPTLASSKVAFGMGALRLTYRETQFFPSGSQARKNPDLPLRFHLA